MWIISTNDVNPITGKLGDSALVHTQEDLDRRIREADKAGVRLHVRPIGSSK